MTTRQPHRYVMELFKRNGAALGQVPVVADWEPAWETARFAALRRFPIATIGPGAVAELRPVWHTDLGAPFVGAVEVALQLPGVGEVSCQVPTTYFKSFAGAASAPFVGKGLLKSGEYFNYRIAAFANPPEPPMNPQRKPRFQIEEVSEPLPIRAASLNDFNKRSSAVGEQNESDIRVFVSKQVVAETEQLARAAGGLETASILVGHVHRDPGGELFLEVTAQIHARYAEATATKVSFGPETWDAVSHALALRGKNEQWLGWWHLHPSSAWCNPKCAPEERAKCPLQRSFFSSDDCDVHRTVFPKAFQVALLITSTDAGLRHAMFSWRNGLIVQRGFHILATNGELNPALVPDATATIGDDQDEKACSR
ncbi:MAG: hypothetical protein C5B50_02220 [Verrucomicrobia bacterium]|nr:MAG: hypothetical protein C5B50_02220 [Verrucomicrobiota bacterium]